jgi:hypothetical protein
MNEEITASTVFDAPTLLPAYKWHGRRTWLLRRWLPLVLIIVSISLAVLGNLQWTNQDIVRVVPVFGLVAFVAWKICFGQKRQISRSIEESSDYKKVVTWMIKEEGLGQRAGESHCFTAWPDVYESVTTPEGALVYPQKEVFYWIPQAAFIGETDYQRFLELLKAKTKHSRVG